MFTIYSDNDAGSTLVPNLFIDEYMRDANDAQIKIYLYLLRMMGAGRSTSISEMADQFNHTEKEVLRSLRYWEARGLITLEYNAFGDLAGIHLTRLSMRPSVEILPQSMPQAVSQSMPQSVSQSMPQAVSQRIAQIGAVNAAGSILPQNGASGQVQEQDAAASPGLTSMTVPGHSGAHFDPLQSPQAPASSRYEQAQPELTAAAPPKKAPDKASLDAFCSNDKRAQLLYVIEQYIGKPLSPNEVQSVYYISEELRFSDALIDYLMQYCIERGKKDFRYIERVAVNWAEHGITTPKQAERAVSPLGKKRGVPGGTRPSANPFNRFEQNQYDFDQLEKEILSN